MSEFSEAPWAVELVDFRKTFRPHWLRPAVAAVSGISLQLKPGAVLGLLGPNGSGKSTTLKALSGLVRPTAGRCFICGHAAGSDAARARVGYLPEAPAIAAHLTGREFLGYCAGLSDVPGDRIDEVLVWSGLGDAAERRLATYSKGMRQRIGIAQAVVHDPPVVLLDEPAGGLDPEGRLMLGSLIRDLAARGKAVVFSSHLLGEAAELCDQIAILGRGRLLALGTPAELLGVAGKIAPQPSRLERLYLEKVGAHE